MAECPHPDIQRFGEIRCCLSCGEAVFEGLISASRSTPFKSSSDYQYKPLRHRLGSEIRLIVLFAGEPSDDLLCDIVTVNLVDRPGYEAVSYTWADSKGDARLTSEIRCGGSTIAITKNCEAALRRLRLQSRNRRLWVDAICINQNDMSEKSHQVRLMSTIYTNAAQVLSYLGVDPSQVANEIRRFVDFCEDGTRALAMQTSMKETLETFFALPYFDRVWILQEIGLAQLVTLIVGNHEIHWTGDTISRTLEMCSLLNIMPPSALRWTPSSRPEEQNDILAVLSKSRNCSATDRRDKVYALLGLMDSKISTEFPVDYSTTFQEVYMRLAHYCIKKLGRFDLLQHCQHVNDLLWLGQNRKPSWIPQWDFKNAAEPLPAQFTAAEKQDFASSWHVVPTNPGAWLRNELPLGLLLERINTDFTSDRDYIVADTNLSTATCRNQVRKWSELESVYNPDSPLSAADDEHLAQQIVHRQSSGFSYKILDQEIHDRDHPAMRRAAEQSSDGIVPTSLKIPCLKLRAHRLDKVVHYLGPIARQRTTIIPQTAWSALGVPYCHICTPPAQSGAAYRASFWQQRRELMAKIEDLGVGKTAFATTHSVGFANAHPRAGHSIWALYGADVPFMMLEANGFHELVGDCYLHRAGRPFLCEHCGHEAAPWPMQTEIIDIW